MQNPDYVIYLHFRYLPTDETDIVRSGLNDGGVLHVVSTATGCKGNKISDSNRATIAELISAPQLYTSFDIL